MRAGEKPGCSGQQGLAPGPSDGGGGGQDSTPTGLSLSWSPREGRIPSL